MVDKQQQIEMIGKVFVVTCGIRRCLICDRVFTPKEAAEYATTVCYPSSEDSSRTKVHLIHAHSFLH